MPATFFSPNMWRKIWSNIAQWQPHLHDLGECEVKHGVRVHALNLYTDEVGNPEVPEKFRETRRKPAAPAKSSSTKWIVAVAAALVIGGVVAVLVVGWWDRPRG